MHIIIPMSGIGQRFIDAGYTTPKPLIMIDGKTIIEHVCDLFPTEEQFTFICNSTHLKETNMREILKSIRPMANIIEIPNHKKGPVYAVSLIKNLIRDDEEVIVNYCDFGTYWDYQDFLHHTRKRNADGAIVAYKGFHPHMLGSTNYAFMREDKQWLLEIQEKQPFTTNRMNEFASNGTYYFKRGSYVKTYFQKLLDTTNGINGEYYVSLVYNLLLKDHLRVSIYEIQHMLQWGTPEDVQEYQNWSKLFEEIVKHKTGDVTPNDISLIPLAGKGSRFANAGYSQPKPMLEISGKPMIIQAASSLPPSRNFLFVVLKQHQDEINICNVINQYFPSSKIITLPHVTDGQAISCKYGLKDIDQNKSLLISATDNAIIYNHKKYQALIQDKDTDVIVFTFRNHISSQINPEMYGWVVTDGEHAKKISVKKPISPKPCHDHAIVGTFWFKKIAIFNEGFKQLIHKDIKVNCEYYIDSLVDELIQQKFNVKIFEVDHYICWGTPNDYETYHYWQSFFHKNPLHPYSLCKDPNVDSQSIPRLEKNFYAFKQKFED